MRFDLTEPCSQCPLRRASCPGWTGLWKPAELLDAIRDRPFPCHPTISHDGQPIEDDTLQSCAGVAIFLNNSGEPTCTGWTRRHQELLQAASEETRKRVFDTPQQFLSHHNRRTAPGRDPAPEP